MDSKEQLAKIYIAIGVFSVFGVVLLFFPWKVAVALLLIWFAFNAIYMSIKIIREEYEEK
jgi:hypothetical protein